MYTKYLLYNVPSRESRPISAMRAPKVRLNQFSNYAIRILMYAGMHGDRPSAVPVIARAYNISFNHLKKAASELCRLGYLEAVRGRVGGVRLARPAGDIVIGEVVRQTEGSVVLVECFDPATNTCPLMPACRLKRALGEALTAFFAVLDGYTLADLIAEPEELALLLGINSGAANATATPNDS
jgi:Rrf2 family nitric oxide-sensitive transcriptional repressor